ncbi:MAG: 4-hydroxy-tetrahydrodipicolinate reductase [Clostridia bacterium]|nr:4-hydroxy-tetrahydrodipicolinate reductase [Clostridia bacterium]MBQ4248857.1 4-hydroxy-tetrahydrodipicolinate reductase [Clostridia bacterium]
MSNVTRIIMSGCNGKMGRAISRLAASDDSVLIVAGLDINTAEEFGYPVFSDPAKVDTECDVIVDFSNHAALEGVLDLARRKKVPAVIATTGLLNTQIELMHETAKYVPIFHSANMSLGVNLLIDLVKRASRALGEDFDVEIIEKHHNQKLDAPSGTALAIADALSSVRDCETNYVYERQSVRKKREKTEIGIHSIRGGNIIGDHDVLFCGQNEVITVSHSAASRDVFAAGAIRAAKFIAGKPAGLYSMNDLINE